MARECSQLLQGQNREQSPPLSGLVYINCSPSSTPQPETHGGDNTLPKLRITELHRLTLEQYSIFLSGKLFWIY